MSILINVKVTVDSDSQSQELNDIEGAYIDIYDERYKKGKKDSWALKNKYAAQLNPFIEVSINGFFYEVIYSEDCQNPIQKLKQDLVNLNKLRSTLSK